MMSRLVLLAVVSIVGFAAVAQADEPESVVVLSFNIRYGTASDGENHWKHRQDRVADTIKKIDPDLLGMQEVLDFQRDFLSQRLPGYEVHSAGRDDGKDQGEMCPIFFRRERFEKLSAGHFWLSETPEVPGSKSWDSSLPRMVSWIRLKDRRFPDQPPILLLNTHFDHRGSEARAQSATLVRKRIVELRGGGDVILCGDFNCGEGSLPYRNMFSDAQANPVPLIDTYRRAHPEVKSNEGTFSGFDVSRISGERIDWIAVSEAWQVDSAEIIRAHQQGRTPSDHFPVSARVRR